MKKKEKKRITRGKQIWKDKYSFKEISAKCNKWTLIGFWLKQAVRNIYCMRRSGKIENCDVITLKTSYKLKKKETQK